MAFMPLLFAIKRTRKLMETTEHQAGEYIHNAFLYLALSQDKLK
jgi:hypothetical protein